MSIKSLTPSTSTIDGWIYDWGETRKVSDLDGITEYIVHKTVEYVVEKLKQSEGKELMNHDISL